MKRSLLSVLFASLLVVACESESVMPTAPEAEPAEAVLVGPSEGCVVARVVDGDSFFCSDGLEVRILSVDAPEMKQAPFGDQARTYLLSRMPVGSTVQLQFDRQRTDKYERTLSYVFDGQGKMVNEMLARDGYAVDLVYSPNTRYSWLLKARVAQAKWLKRGLWATGGFNCLPVDFRAGRCG